MWIKSLNKSREVWVNMNHITHFSIKLSGDPPEIRYDVVAYLNASHEGLDPRQHEIVDGQAFITVKRGTHEECEEFIKEKLFLQSAWQWIGYLVAGGVGAVLTYLFQKLGS